MLSRANVKLSTVRTNDDEGGVASDFSLLDVDMYSCHCCFFVENTHKRHDCGTACPERTVRRNRTCATRDNTPINI